MTENISTGTQTSPTAEYEPLKVDFTPTPAVVPLVAWTWNTPVIPQFYWNVYSAEQRIKQICLEIGRIQEYLNYFAAHYNKMSGYLNKRIDKLTAAMYAEVERLDKSIEEENKARKLADELLQKGLDAEIARAKAAEIVLQQNIDANTTLIEDEEKRAKDAEEKLTTDLHDETAARVAEDKKINDTVETNRQHAEEVDAQLFDSIRTEANIRKNADNLLSDRIDKETEERKADNASINTRIDNEHAERVKADNTLDKRITDNQQAIEHEVERAKSAENNLNDALEREIDARVDTDRSLENSIDTNDRASKERDNKLQGNIDAEIANRGNAENAINDRITNEISNRKADDASINTRIDKEVEERKNDVVSLNTQVDNEQNERVKADNALDKRVNDNAQSIEHETERAKSAETNLNDALEREVDARQDDTRNLENQIDKVSTDSAKRDGVLQANIDIEAEKRATEDNKKVGVTNIKAAENSRITVTTANENTENATVTIGDTFNADFNKVNEDIEAEKQRAIAKENELSGKVEHETQERQTETTALNAEVAKRPTLDKFIAGDNITLTPDVDKTTLTISAKNNIKVKRYGGLLLNENNELTLDKSFNFNKEIIADNKFIELNETDTSVQINSLREMYFHAFKLVSAYNLNNLNNNILSFKYTDIHMLPFNDVNITLNIDSNEYEEYFKYLKYTTNVLVNYPYIYINIIFDTSAEPSNTNITLNNFVSNLTVYIHYITNNNNNNNNIYPIKNWATFTLPDRKLNANSSDEDIESFIKEFNEANKGIYIYDISLNYNKNNNINTINVDIKNKLVEILWIDGSKTEIYDAFN